MATEGRSMIRRASFPVLTLPKAQGLSRVNSCQNTARSEAEAGSKKPSPSSEDVHKCSRRDLRRPSALQLRSLATKDSKLSAVVKGTGGSGPMAGAVALALRKSRYVYMAEAAEASSDPFSPIKSVESSEVGMVKLVYQKARSIRQARSGSQEAKRPALKEVVQDICHAYRVCMKAKHFLDLALDGAMNARKAKLASLAAMAKPSAEKQIGELEDPGSPPTTTETVNVWSSLLNALDLSPSPCRTRSRAGNGTATVKALLEVSQKKAEQEILEDAS